MATHEKDPLAIKGSFSCLDLYNRAISALVAASVSRDFAMQQQDTRPSSLGISGSSILSDLPYVTREHFWTGRVIDTVKYGSFSVSDNHHMTSDKGLQPRACTNPQELQRRLNTGTAALHIYVDTRGFSQHYDIFYPDQLEPGERLHPTIYDVNPKELQYQTPAGWPEGQPLLHKLQNGDAYSLISDPGEDANLCRIYTKLGNIAI